MDDEVLTVPEAARIFRWAPSTLYEKCARGEVPHLRLAGGRRKNAIRFTRKLIEDYLRKSIVTTKATAA